MLEMSWNVRSSTFGPGDARHSTGSCESAVGWIFPLALKCFWETQSRLNREHCYSRDDKGLTWQHPHAINTVGLGLLLNMGLIKVSDTEVNHHLDCTFCSTVLHHESIATVAASFAAHPHQKIWVWLKRAVFFPWHIIFPKMWESKTVGTAHLKVSDSINVWHTCNNGACSEKHKVDRDHLCGIKHFHCLIEKSVEKEEEGHPVLIWGVTTMTLVTETLFQQSIHPS